MIDISVIIPVYNAAGFIGKCLDSIIAQKGNYSYEVILVDDGSIDNSIEVIKSYGNDNFKIITQKNAGPSAARNRGVKEAKGKYLAFIDSDDKWYDSFFSVTYDFLEKHEECIGVSVTQKHHTISRDIIIPTCYKNYTEPLVINDFFSFWADWMHICTGSVLIRTDIVRLAGGMREDLRITEDLEFWALLSTYGKWGYIPDILFVAEGRDSVAPGKWMERMKIRWYNAPTISNWQMRIVSRIGNESNTEGFKKALGQISRNLTYCHIMSNREKEGRLEVKLYGKYYPHDMWGRLMNMCKSSSLLWMLMCKVIQYREKHRFAS